MNTRLHTRRVTTTVAATLAAALTLGALTACSPAEQKDAAGQATQSSAGQESGAQEHTPAAAGADQAAFPLTIKHALGETQIEKMPERVATVGWGNQEVPLALGVVPVGMSKVTWGDDNGDGVLPWVEAKLKEMGAETPELFDETDGIPFEQIAATEPDVILAAYSGLSKEDYETLSKIAPVVAYPDVPWATSLQDMVTLDSTALGLKTQGEKLNADLDAEVAKALEAHPELKGKKVLFTAFGGTTDKSKIGFYTTGDSRMAFLAEHGFGVPSVVADAKSDEFWVEVSAEKPELFEDVDFIVTYSTGDDAKTLQELQADPLLSKIPAIAKGHVAFLPEGPLGAAANQSPLSIPATISEYFDALAAAIK